MDKATKSNVPKYIVKKPWYKDEGEEDTKADESIPNIPKRNSTLYSTTATKYRKGSCKNCGSMTHKAKECLDRPRKKGAKWTGENIQPDEYLDQAKLDFDGKRDRWGNYDPEEYQNVVDNYEELEKKRKKVLEADLKRKLMSGEVSQVQAAVDLSDDERYAEKVDMPGQKVDMEQHTRVTVRNLRIREDTAKYLRNLDTESAYYDPKSRSMRENPYSHTDSTFIGDNVYENTGDARTAKDMQIFAWQAEKRGIQTSVPSEMEKVFNQERMKDFSQLHRIQKELEEKYGVQEQAKDEPVTVSETFVEYDKEGSIKVRSRFREDHFINGHTTVFGSYWENSKWGYKCCKQLSKNAYCTADNKPC